MNLRRIILKDGVYLAVRQLLGIVISLVGVILITRAIGPGNYGLYAAALGIVGYASNLAGLGVHVYIIRRPNEPGMDVFHQAFTLMLISGVLGVALGAAAVPLLQRWLQNPAFGPPLLVMLFTLPLTILSGPAMAGLERNLRYRSVAVIELTGQLVNYTIALILAYRGEGVWAPVAGYVVGQLYLLAATCAGARIMPRPYWRLSLVKEMLSYGVGYSASMWVWQLRSLVNPLLVGRFAGPEAVGWVALAIRLVEAMSFIKGVTWRISIAVLGKLHGNLHRLKQALEDAMLLQVLAVGPLLAVFACVAPLLLPRCFGEQWQPVLIIYPFIALGYLINALFSIHSSVLYVLGRNWKVTGFHAAHIILFVGGALLFIPRWGLLGYGLAEVLALVGYLVIYRQVEHLLCPSYRSVVPWLLAFLPPLWAAKIIMPIGLLFWIPLLIVVAVIKPGKKIIGYMKFAKMGE